MFLQKTSGDRTKPVDGAGADSVMTPNADGSCGGIEVKEHRRLTELKGRMTSLMCTNRYSRFMPIPGGASVAMSAIMCAIYAALRSRPCGRHGARGGRLAAANVRARHISVNRQRTPEDIPRGSGSRRPVLLGRPVYCSVVE